MRARGLGYVYQRQALLSQVPPQASVTRGGTELTVSPGELVIGDVMILRPG